MESIYLYKSHAWYWFYISDRKLTDEELYCADCDDSDWLVAIYSDRNLLLKKMQELFRNDWKLLLTEKNKEFSHRIIPQRYLKPRFADLAY